MKEALLIKTAEAGNAKKDDVLVRITPGGEDLQIHITSTVYALYGAQIKDTVKSVLVEYGVSKATVDIDDYGALDFALRARTETAILRASGGGMKC